MCLSEGLRLTQILYEVDRWMFKIIFSIYIVSGALGVTCSASPIINMGIME